MATQPKTTNPLQELRHYGQSIWLDYIRRSLMTTGELKRLVEEDGLSGMTSNPAIFEKAIAESSDYKDVLQALAWSDLGAKDIYERLAVDDIRMAATVLEPVFRATEGYDGYVSMEVSPYLAHDTQGTIEEAKRLCKMIARPNVMIKVPATPEGIPAIEELTAQGVNVNVTLIFSLEVYEEVALAYIRGMERLSITRQDLSDIASVASFFVSRIDTAVDKLIDERSAASSDPEKRGDLQNIRGKVAIANAKLAYLAWKDIFTTSLWKRLEAKGARTQRLLWASTGTKDPAYSDVLYIEGLIGPDTINTMPPSTLKAFKDHGRVRPTLTEHVEQAYHTMNALQTSGISFKVVTDQLLADAVTKFSKPFDSLLAKLRDMTERTRSQKPII
jgi:transaldolase